MIDETVMERVAKNVGCAVEDLKVRFEAKYAEHGEHLSSHAPEGQDVALKVLRMAAAEMRAETARLNRSGCEAVEGMFISCPRYKDWGGIAYKKMSQTLEQMDEAGRINLVSQGVIALYLNDDINGGFRFVHNPSLVNKEPFHASSIESHVSDLPKNVMKMEDETGYFACIENNSIPTWPNGGQNFRYGAFRRLEDLSRDCLFWGRTKDNQKLRLIKVKITGEDAKIQHPTFVAGKIPLKMGNTGEVGYAKKGVSVFQKSEGVAALFTEAPFNEDMTGGPLADMGITVLKSLSDIKPYVEGLDPKEKWDALCAIPLEVAHIDPREKGGFILTLADLDITSPEMPLDLYISKEEEGKVDFSVGSIVCAIGSGWVHKDDGGGRMSMTSWYALQTIEQATLPLEEESDESDSMGW